MAHAQKPDLVFQRKGRRAHLNRRGSQFSRLLAAEVCASAVVMVVMLDTPCSEVECKTTGYPLYSPVSPLLPLPCVAVCHQVSSELYHKTHATVTQLCKSPFLQTVSAKQLVCFFVLHVKYCHRKEIEICFAKILVILLGGVFTLCGSFANIWTDLGGWAA